MKTILAIGIGVTFLVLAGIGMYRYWEERNLLYLEERNLYGYGENDVFHIKVGEEISIKVFENASTGHINCWINPYAAKSVKAQKGAYESSLHEKRGYVGSGGSTAWTLTGIRKGIDTLKFRFCPVLIEQKRCEDYFKDTIPPDNIFIIHVSDE